MRTEPRAARWRRTPLITLLVLAVLVGLASCGDDGGDEGGGGDEPAAEGALVVYSGRNENLVGPLLERFTEETGIPVQAQFGDSSDLALQLGEEGEATEADVFFSQSPGATEYLDAQGLLADLPDDVLSLVPADRRASDGTWVGVTGRVRVLVYNEELVSEDELPGSVLDLTDPAYEGRVAVAPTNASFQDFVGALREELGDEATAAWLEGMAANESPNYSSNNDIVQAVAAGQVPMGLVNHYYNARLLSEQPDQPSRNHFFAEGDLGSITLLATVSKLASSDNPDAERLVEFLLSEGSQEYFATETFEYPLVEGVAPPEGLPALEPLVVELDELGSDFEATLALIDESGIVR